jgi:hypothetical protein
MGGASEDVETLKEPDTVREVAKVLRTNVKVCAALGQPFIAQMGRIYLDMLNVYVLLCALCAVCCVLCAVHCVLCAVGLDMLNVYDEREKERKGERERETRVLYFYPEVFIL